MKLTTEWLEGHFACQEGIDWLAKQEKRDYESLLQNLIEDNATDCDVLLEWGNWFIARRLSSTKSVEYAVFAARSVLDIYEKKYPDDTRPREAIEAAEKYIGTNAEADAADAMARAADAADAEADAEADAAADAEADTAAYAAYAAARAAYAATYAADAAARAAYAAADAADAAYAAAYAADAVCAAARAARTELQIKILKYGLKLLDTA